MTLIAFGEKIFLPIGAAELGWNLSL